MRRGDLGGVLRALTNRETDAMDRALAVATGLWR
jgi:hypothetical protein